MNNYTAAGFAIIATLLVPGKTWYLLAQVAATKIRAGKAETPIQIYGNWWSHRQTASLSALTVLFLAGAFGS